MPKLTISQLEGPLRQQAIPVAYRHLYRTGLRTIRYAKPNRYVLRNVLRQAFRKGAPSEFEPRRIVGTLGFLERAAETNGIEHKIVKNLLHVRFWQQPTVRQDGRVFHPKHPSYGQIKSVTHAAFDTTLKMFNDSLGLCLR